jgi:hypothetical protein
MSGLGIDYSDLRRSLQGARRVPRPGRLPRWVRTGAFWGALAVLPFVLLIRGGVFAYHAWGLGTWLSVGVSALATAGLLGIYAWWGTRRLGARLHVSLRLPG